ncbi:EF-hand domain-containing protein [Hwanghaeella sp.]|uniref:EF-hand domain-containing protein n=1 Tax=Hwanghaeella sp. TaxID=2605943 RepID=UPI003CCBAB5D
MLKTSLFALILITPVAAFADGMSSPERIAEHIFKNADSNGDGEMTRAEHDAAKLARYGSTFEMFDIDKNERVTYQEYLGVFLRYHTGNAGKDA